MRRQRAAAALEELHEGGHAVGVDEALAERRLVLGEDGDRGGGGPDRRRRHAGPDVEQQRRQHRLAYERAARPLTSASDRTICRADATSSGSDEADERRRTRRRGPCAWTNWERSCGWCIRFAVSTLRQSVTSWIDFGE